MLVAASPNIPIRPPLKDWYSRKEAARYLATLGYQVAPQTLANMASNNNAGHGPPFVRFRWRLTQYRRIDLDAWAKQQMQPVA